MSSHITISVVGDEELKARMRALASLNRTTMGTLVRQAIDLQYGDDLEKIFPNSGSLMYHTAHKTKNAQE
jgi:uncharacterized protein with ACT and thioredoxin-like domain